MFTNNYILEDLFEIVTAFGAIAAVFVAIIAVVRADKISKREIRVSKIEEIYELIHTLNRYYGVFSELNSNIQSMLDRNNHNVRTMNDYYKIRDGRIPPDERKLFLSKLSRFEVLIKCYTRDDLKKELIHYEDLLYSFSDLVFNAGSSHKELKWKDGFPDYEEFYKLSENMKSELVSLINKS